MLVGYHTSGSGGHNVIVDCFKASLGAVLAGGRSCSWCEETNLISSLFQILNADDVSIRY